MKAFDLAWTLLKQGKVRRGFGDSPFPQGRTPMQEKDQQRLREAVPFEPRLMRRGFSAARDYRNALRQNERDSNQPIASIGPSYDEIQRVLTKLMSGEPLTPEEEVILNQQRTQL